MLPWYNRAARVLAHHPAYLGLHKVAVVSQSGRLRSLVAALRDFRSSFSSTGDLGQHLYFFTAAHTHQPCEGRQREMRPRNKQVEHLICPPTELEGSQIQTICVKRNLLGMTRTVRDHESQRRCCAPCPG